MKYEGKYHTGLDIEVTPALEKAFWKKVQRDETTGCLLWMGKYNRKGYGRLVHKGRTYLAHRVAWCMRYKVRNFNYGLVSDHLCRVPPCCDYTHLEPVTESENQLRGINPKNTRARFSDFRFRTHCEYGHVVEKKFLRGHETTVCKICLKIKRVAYTIINKEKIDAYTIPYRVVNRRKHAMYEKWRRAKMKGLNLTFSEWKDVNDIQV